MAEALHPDEAAAFPPMWAELGAKDADGRASGAAVAGFLRAANVPTESLQRLWALVDTAGVGSLDQAQFYAVMRYVALCQRDVSAEVSAARLGSFAGMPLVPLALLPLRKVPEEERLVIVAAWGPGLSC